MDNNIFFDANVPAEIDSTPIDISQISKAEIIPQNTAKPYVDTSQTWAV